MSDWKDVLKPTKIDLKQKAKILKGRNESFEGKIRLLNIFGEIPDSVWNVRYSQKLDLKKRNQNKVAEQHRNATEKIFDNSTRNQNIRRKGAISMFPRQILEQLLDFYTLEGDLFLDPFAGHNSRMEASFRKGRNYVGWDCSHEFMEFNREVRKKLLQDNPKNTTIILNEGDSRKLDCAPNSADFIFSSPPYWNLEWYGDEDEQLGKLSYEDFMKDMTTIYKRCYDALKPGKFCIINVNDFRKDGKYFSYHTDTIKALNEAGFKQYDLIIMKYANAMRKSFPNQIFEVKLQPKIHEYLLVFFKPPEYEHQAFYPFKQKVNKNDEKS